ncbi:hypothetical protein WICPIJ_002935 [Wickerhamomyces pijperi]|uniref:Uncharacterized protein n=1 Tax=Wickerhamomyces pijperi TaxID=599730 RepID=A0A9P8Q8N3_WICPI|nr:hypothetical protein WICPIJ_002935 [Wickerhamomyces pijperi]
MAICLDGLGAKVGSGSNSSSSSGSSSSSAMSIPSSSKFMRSSGVVSVAAASLDAAMVGLGLISFLTLACVVVSFLGLADAVVSFLGFGFSSLSFFGLMSFTDVAGLIGFTSFTAAVFGLTGFFSLLCVVFVSLRGFGLALGLGFVSLSSTGVFLTYFLFGFTSVDLLLLSSVFSVVGVVEVGVFFVDVAAVVLVLAAAVEGDFEIVLAGLGSIFPSCGCGGGGGGGLSSNMIRSSSSSSITIVSAESVFATSGAFNGEV